MKKSILLLAMLGNVGNVSHANEGMWMPQQLPQVTQALKTAGLQLDPAALTRLTEFPMSAVVSLGGCSASFVSPQGLVVTNHHCVYGSVAQHSRPERNLLVDGFLAKTFADELPAVPGTRVFVTEEVGHVTAKMVTAEVAALSGKQRFDALEKNEKTLVAACEKDPGHRCTVASFYGGLEFYLIKQLEIRDVRLVHAPAEGVGKFGGETDNWMWPRHTGDYGFYRAYVSKDGKPADFNKDNVPYMPKHFLTLAKEALKEGDFVMALGYPGRTNRHRLPSEVAFTFDWNYPAFVKASTETIAIIENETKDRQDVRLKYANQIASINNYLKNRQGMLDSYANSDLLQRKTKEHAELKNWVQADAKRRAEFSADIAQVEQLIAQRDAQIRRDFYFNAATPRLLTTAHLLYRLARESTKPDAERKPGYQARDLPRIKSRLDAIERSYDDKVDQAVVLNSLRKYAAQSAKERNASFDTALGIKEGMTQAELKTLLASVYAGSVLGDKTLRANWLGCPPEAFANSSDRFIQIAIAMFDDNLKREAEDEALSGKLQQAYANYMKAKMAYMQSKGQTIYPDANSTLRVTFGNIAGRSHGADGTAWMPFTTVRGVLAKATGSGEFNAPALQLAAIKARDFGPYRDPVLGTVPVNFLATLDITGGNSGSAVLNAKGQLIGLAFDGTLDSIISDWDYNPANTRSIQVDLRYMLWQMKQVDKAGALLKEMGVE